MDEKEFNALPLDQRKAIQQRLKDQNLYAGGIDGKWGSGTKTALDLEESSTAKAKAAERKDELRAQELEIEKLKAKSAAKESGAATAETERKTALKKKYEEEAGSALGLTARAAAGPGAVIAGVPIGRKMGAGINELMNLSQEGKNKTLAAAAEDRMRGVTTREGGRTGTNLAGAMPSKNSAVRVTGRMLPHMLLGGVMAGKGAALLGQSDENTPFYSDMLNQGAGIGMISAGSGIAERGIAHGIAPRVPPDARSIAIIESNQLRRQGQPGSTAQALAGGPTKAALYEQARLAGIPGRSKMNRDQLAKAVAGIESGGGPSRIASAASKAPRVLAPLAAGALAYDAASNAAEAGGMSPVAQTASGAGAAGAAAAGTYGAARGIDKLMSAIPQAARTAAGAGLQGVAAPLSIDAMTDYSPEDLNYMRNVAARNMPSWMRAGGVEDAYQMAQVPERNPERSAPPPDFSVPGEQQDVQTLIAQGAPPELIAAYLNHVAAQ